MANGLEVNLFGEFSDVCLNFANTDCPGCYLLEGEVCLGPECEFYELENLDLYKILYQPC